MTQQKALIVSVSGIRGIVGESLTPETAMAFAAALGTYVEGRPVVLCRDGRPSGVMLRRAVLAGLLEAGCEVHDLGVAPTPTCGLAVRRLGAAGGIQITASHNPAEWNGLKLFGPDGMVLAPDAGQKIAALFEACTFRRGDCNTVRRQVSCDEAEGWHCKRVLELIDVQRIQARRLRTFLDANGGAGGSLGCSLLRALHANPVCHACGTDGVFAHPPEPTLDNLQAVCPLVAQHGADVGFVLDPDADRLAVIDETGRYIGEELTLGLAVWFRLGQERGPIVINMSTSRICEDIAGRFDCPCHRTAVGEVNVVLKMREVGAVIGGEGNGGVIDPRVGWVRDPFIGMGIILNLLAETGKKLSQLVAELPAYHIVKDKYVIDRDRLPTLFAALTKRWPDTKVNRLDGLRLDWEDRWVHIRPSNTEPIVRVIAEAPRLTDAKELSRQVGELLRSAEFGVRSAES